jgi:signal transduction histidine kinase
VTTPASNERRNRGQWLLLAAALLLVGALLGWEALAEHRRIATAERDRLRALARTVEQNVARQIDATRRALDAARGHLAGDAGPLDLNGTLRDLSGAMPGVRTVLVTDGAGRIVGSSRPELLGRDVSHRDYFATPRARPDPATLYLSPPFRTSLGAHGMQLTLAVAGPRGEFAGVVGATLDPEYFEIVLSSVLYAEDMRAALWHGEGRQFLAVPQSDEEFGKDLGEPGTPFTRHRESGALESTFLDASEGGDGRLLALRTVQPGPLGMDEPLVVVLGRDAGAVHAGWRRGALARAALFACLATGAVLGLWVHRRRQSSAERRVAEAQAALRLSEARHRAIAESFPNGAVLLFDRDLRFVVAGGEALRALGTPPAGLLGRTLGEALPADAARALEPAYRAALAGRSELLDLEARGRTFEILVTPVLGDGEVAYGLVRAVDVTERRALDARMSAAERLAALGRMVGGIAHELNNPLTYTATNARFAAEQLAELAAELARAGGDGVRERLAEVEAALRDAQHGAARVAAIVAKLRTAAGAHVEPRARVQLARVATAAASLAAGEILPRARFRRTLREGIAVEGDPARLEQVVANLLSNAAHAIAEGAPERNEVAITVDVQGDGRAFVEVTDTGCGIRPEDMARVFDPFFTTKAVGAGMGLGLAVCHGIVAAHGGEMQVRSTPGEGSSFRVLLPVATAASADEARA